MVNDINQALKIWPKIEVSNRIKDLTNYKFGKLICLYRTFNNKNNKSMWVCQCECGNIKAISAANLQQQKTQSCGCLQKRVLKQISKNNIKDLTNQRFGKLLVLKFIETKNRRAQWLCQCDCGNQKIIDSGSLLSGKIYSCGCFKKSIGEAEIEKYLRKNNSQYKQEYTFPDLKYKAKLRFDFALLDKNQQLLCLIEYQGYQHFQTNTIYGKEQREITDNLKKNYCLNNKISLYEITYKDNIQDKLNKIIQDLIVY